MQLRHRAVIWMLAALALTSPGCASTTRKACSSPCANTTWFDFVGIIDFRCQSVDDYLAMVQPGDLIVNYMRAGRAVKEDQWLSAILPYGHAMIAMEPTDLEHGLLEARFHGVRCVGVDQLKRCSYNLIYRLHDHHRLDMNRVRRAADHECECCKKYSFKSWIALNDNLRPNTLDEFSSKYTCSTFVAAVYHYAGVTLEVATKDHKVITPLSLAASHGRFNERALAPNAVSEAPLLEREIPSTPPLH